MITSTAWTPFACIGSLVILFGIGYAAWYDAWSTKQDAKRREALNSEQRQSEVISEGDQHGSVE